jgi:hypothetical protein
MNSQSGRVHQNQQVVGVFTPFSLPVRLTQKTTSQHSGSTPVQPSDQKLRRFQGRINVERYDGPRLKVCKFSVGSDFF